MFLFFSLSLMNNGFYPHTFKSLINVCHDLAKLINNSGLKGIQLHQDTFELLIILFADDVALMSDTVVGLQNQLIILHGFCEETGLTVNTNKTKIMVFKNVGRLSWHKYWSYDINRIDIFSKFTYVGVTFTSKLSTNIMSANQAGKAKRALISVLNSVYKCGHLPSNIFF